MIGPVIEVPLTNANYVNTITQGYKITISMSYYDWWIGVLSTGLYFAMNGSDGNMLTFVEPWQNPAPWAAYASNYTALTEQVLAYVTFGTVYMKEVPFDYNLTIPENIQVIENVNGLTRIFVSNSSSEGSQYTVSRDTVNNGYYMCQDSAGRYINTWTSTNFTALFNSVASLGGVLSLDSGEYIRNGTLKIVNPLVCKGAGTSTHITTLYSEASPFINVMSSNVTVQDMALEGWLWKSAGTDGWETVDGRNGTCELMGVLIVPVSGASELENIVMQRLSFVNMSWGIIASSGNYHLDNLRILNNNFVNLSTAIQLNGAGYVEGCITSQNYIENTQDDGIAYLGSYGSPVCDRYIANSIINDNVIIHNTHDGCGIKISTMGGSVYSITVKGNTITNSSRCIGIWCETDSDRIHAPAHIVIDGNALPAKQTVPSPAYGPATAIQWNSYTPNVVASGSVISNNIISTDAFGIVFGNSKSLSLEGNVINQTKTYSGNRYLVFIHNSSDIHIKNNVLQTGIGSTIPNIYAYTSSNIDIEGNTITAGHYDNEMIQIINSTYVKMLYNTFNTISAYQRVCPVVMSGDLCDYAIFQHNYLEVHSTSKYKFLGINSIISDNTDLSPEGTIGSTDIQATMAHTSSCIYLGPYTFSQIAYLTSIDIYTCMGGTGSDVTLIIGLYSVNSTGHPDALVCSGEATSAIRVIGDWSWVTCNFNTIVDAGDYYIRISPSNNPGFYFRLSSITGSGVCIAYGAGGSTNPETAVLTSFDTNRRIYSIYVTHSYLSKTDCLFTDYDGTMTGATSTPFTYDAQRGITGSFLVNSTGTQNFTVTYPSQYPSGGAIGGIPLPYVWLVNAAATDFSATILLTDYTQTGFSGVIVVTSASSTDGATVRIAWKTSL
jgi:hypothetical protein